MKNEYRYNYLAPVKKRKHRIKKEKAITLIALLITVIILVILAAISISVAYNSGLIDHAIKGAQDYIEESNKEQETLKSIEKTLEDVLGVKEEDEDDEEDDEDEFIPAISTGEYKYETDTPNSVKYYSPDLTGFNGKQTYYVVYDENGNESIPGRTDLMDPSKVEGWYDYENKKWANVVTVNDSTITYWVWIPRYMYYVNSGEAEIYFVDITNTCTLKYEGSESTFKPEEIDEKTFRLSDAFTFDEKELKGYWISKYEIQYDETQFDYRVIAEKDGKNITISTVAEGGPYYLYIDGIKQNNTVTLPTTVQVNNSKDFQIMLVDVNTGKISTTSINGKITVDLSGFNPERTFYVEYDSLGNEKLEKTKIQVDANGIPTNAPKNWYNYDNKRWANIVTVNDNSITYWTYIPRYEYRNIPGIEIAEAYFIPKSKVEADKGFSIPDSFTFDGQPLHGYWISKYEVQYQTNENRIVTTKTGNNLIINTVETGNGPYLLYINGVKQDEEISSLPATISVDTTRDNFLMLIDKTTGKILTTLEEGTIQIDLSGFNTSCTYYVEYNEDGTEKTGEKTKIQVDANGNPTNAPENWYNYNDKKWANIMTNNNGLITYWTYIPRYEYRIISGIEVAEINFLPVGEDPQEGFTVPDAFTFDNVPLKGYWISKYEVQEKNN